MMLWNTYKYCIVNCFVNTMKKKCGSTFVGFPAQGFQE